MNRRAEKIQPRSVREGGLTFVTGAILASSRAEFDVFQPAEPGCRPIRRSPAFGYNYNGLYGPLH